MEVKKAISLGKRVVGVLAGLRFRAGQTMRPMLLGSGMVGEADGLEVSEDEVSLVVGGDGF